MSKRKSGTRLYQSVAAVLLVLTSVLPLLEARHTPAEVSTRGPNKPIAHSLIPQSDFIVTQAGTASVVKHERVWNSSFVFSLSDPHLTKLPRQITEEGGRLTADPARLLLITIQSSSER